MGIDQAFPGWFSKAMPRPLRIERPGGRLHVTARGNGRMDIFRNDTDRFHFLELLGQFPFANRAVR
jgi:hypothetical protein